MKSTILEFYPLRKSLTGFRQWCRVYLKRSELEIRLFESITPQSPQYKIDNEKAYNEACLIQDQLKSLLLTLNVIEEKIFQEKFVKGKSEVDCPTNQFTLYKEMIYEKWCSICFQELEDKRKKQRYLNAQHIGLLLKELRENKGYSIKQVSELIGLNHNTLRNYEKGHRTPKISRINEIISVYGITFAYFMNRLENVGVNAIM